VTLEPKNYARLAGGLTILFVTAAALMAWALPGAAQAFDYLIAGTFASAVTLTAAFGLFVWERSAISDQLSAKTANAPSRLTARCRMLADSNQCPTEALAALS
jgi:uncharacterized transporter YbjL